MTRLCFADSTGVRMIWDIWICGNRWLLWCRLWIHADIASMEIPSFTPTSNGQTRGALLLSFKGRFPPKWVKIPGHLWYLMSLFVNFTTSNIPRGHSIKLIEYEGLIRELTIWVPRFHLNAFKIPLNPISSRLISLNLPLRPRGKG